MKHRHRNLGAPPTPPAGVTIFRVVTLLALYIIGAIGCLRSPDVPQPDASVDDGGSRRPSAPAGPFLEVRDRLGQAYRPDATPTWPVLRVSSDVSIIDTSALVLVASEGDAHDLFDDLLGDLSRAPLRAGTLSAAISLRTRLEDGVLVAEPQSHLPRGRRFLLGLGAWAYDPSAEESYAWATPITVAEDPSSGAWAAESFPADATHGVPPTLPVLAVRFDGLVDVGNDALFLDGPDGRVPASVVEVPCPEIGWRVGSCAALRPATALAEQSRFTLRVADTVVDRSGAPTGPFRAELTTGRRGLVDAPALTETPCGLDERATNSACALEDDRRVTLRLTLTAPARIFLSAMGQETSAIAPRGEATLSLDGLPSDTTFDAQLQIVGLGGQDRLVDLVLATTVALPPLSITEVCADPLGPEPAQEWVELLNSGAMPIDPTGFRLADSPDREGDLVSSAVSIPPGGRLLLVSDGFDSQEGADAPVPGGVPVARLGTSLGSGGLSNAGEPVILRDPLGHRVSAAPAIRAPAGQCIARRDDADARRGDDDAFIIAPCTPGRPP